MSEKAIPMFCYRDENQYEEFLSVFADARALPVTFEAWKRNAEITIQVLLHQGIVVNRAYADSKEEFIEFCRIFGYVPDSKARFNFAFLKSQQ